MNLKRYKGKELIQHLVETSIKELQEFLQLTTILNEEKLKSCSSDVQKIENLCIDLNFRFYTGKENTQ